MKLSRQVLKVLSIFVLLLLLQSTLFGQIITVRVMESFAYKHQSDAYNFYITEKLKYLQINRLDKEERVLKFNNHIKAVYDFLEENKLSYTILATDPAILERNARQPINLQRVDIKISSDASTRDKIMNYVNEQPGLIFRNAPLKEDLDDSFIKSCIDQLADKARAEAAIYARTQNKLLGNIHEMEIIRQKVTQNSTRKTPDNPSKEPWTHTAMFEIKFSFETKMK